MALELVFILRAASATGAPAFDAGGAGCPSPIGGVVSVLRRLVAGGRGCRLRRRGHFVRKLPSDGDTLLNVRLPSEVTDFQGNDSWWSPGGGVYHDLWY